MLGIMVLDVDLDSRLSPALAEELIRSHNVRVLSMVGGETIEMALSGRVLVTANADPYLPHARDYEFGIIDVSDVVDDTSVAALAALLAQAVTARRAWSRCPFVIKIRPNATQYQDLAAAQPGASGLKGSLEVSFIKPRSGPENGPLAGRIVTRP